MEREADIYEINGVAWPAVFVLMAEKIPPQDDNIEYVPWNMHTGEFYSILLLWRHHLLVDSCHLFAIILPFPSTWTRSV